jgi:NAD(P)-dependent dehydrogenase (short-subunit alcohol dehydrogenase family)
VNLLLTPRALVRRHLVDPVARLAGSPLPSPLAGKVVLVTGASSGVGEATAKAVAARGGVVLCVARRPAELDRVVREIEEAGGSAHGYACDLTDASATDALVEQVLVEHDAVDLLVNNAGRSIRRSLELSYDRMHDFERTMAINYFGPVRLTLGLLPRMRERRFGHVVNIVTWACSSRRRSSRRTSPRRPRWTPSPGSRAARRGSTTSPSPTCGSTWCAPT